MVGAKNSSKLSVSCDLLSCTSPQEYEGKGGLSLWKKNNIHHKMELEFTKVEKPEKADPVATPSVSLVTREVLEKGATVKGLIEEFVEKGEHVELQFASDIDPVLKEVTY